MSTVRNPHADSRLPKVLDEAARLFRTRGFEGTSVREIAKAVGMLPGSLYCHFETKEALLVAVYVKGVQQIIEAVQSAAAGALDPWERLEAACVAHLEAILHDDDYAQVVVRVRPADVPVAHESLIELRNTYEDLFAGLIRDLPLARGTDRRVLRLMLMGAMNWSQTWYRPGGRFNPRAIARKFIALLRQGQEVAA
ncbi:TetR/AcrR family transcriptional regulator [Ramlibacter sp. RBP-2]|uniref:TetR/AcrR family transcriptional regulator n=1 Tax=Ramlibacter lithotrophicus TaxID=2606681 RepID=A0A7X6DFR0_9BURK|nr:TetR/AcrR family transcriptional regulator [Ramlibacter lithotrophicus]NKE66307.1 TetR/AcrR family transcriptional regulator [Ramlibacter lithotrophicus]